MNQASLNPQVPLAEEHSWVSSAGQGALGHYFDGHIRNTSPSKTLDGDCYTQNRCPFHYRDAKVGSKEIPGVIGKFGLEVQNEAGQRLTEFCQENVLVIENSLFQQHKELYTWASSEGQYQNQTDYILCSQRWRSSTQSAKTKPGADCGSDHELLIARFRLK